MAYRILSAAIVACLAGLSAAPASADSTYESRCSRDKWSKIYKCWSEYDSPYTHSSTDCSGGSCYTKTESKPQPQIRLPEPPPRPILPPTRVFDRSGVAVMRGMPQ